MKKLALVFLCALSANCYGDDVQDKLDERNRQEQKIQDQKIQAQKLEEQRLERLRQDAKIEENRRLQRKYDDAAWDRQHGRDYIA